MTKACLPIDKANIKINKISLLITVFVVVLSTFLIGCSAQAREINLENIVMLTNKTRVNKGLSELLINPTLTKVASKKAKHMVKYHYFSHVSPEGIDPWYWFKNEGYDYKYAGENLAINYKTAEDQMIAWMKSPTHRKNILSSNYKEIGVATASGYINGKPASVTVQVFGTPQKPINNSTSSDSNQKITRTSPLIPYVLGEEISYSAPTQYLSKIGSKSEIQKTNVSFISYLWDTVKKQSHNLLWVTALTLIIVIIRDIVLRSITSPTVHKHSMTNVVLLLMLWSIFISM